MDTTHRQESAILAAVRLPETDPMRFEESLAELKELAWTAGVKVEGIVVQEREALNPKTYIGSGKAKEIKALAGDTDADLVIFNNDLSPTQQRNIEDLVGCRVLDRTALILDIFAQRARSKEGTIQVELAQDEYRLPRLRGKGIELSRLHGGIVGTRGPGETKLEVDRRRIQQRIRHLKQELAHIGRVRSTQAKRRKKSGVFSVSLVGYTNAGKSTLLNRLTDADVFAEDTLFATLDSTTRQLALADGKRKIVLTDTVGFIQDLPTQLVAAFRSTLEGIREADLLLHVVDVSYERFRDRMEAVDEVLGQLGASAKQQIIVLNKIDAAIDVDCGMLRREFPDGVCVSALEGTGMDELVSAIDAVMAQGTVRIDVFIPADRRALLERLYEEAKIIFEQESEQGTAIVADVPRSFAPEVEEFGRR